METTGIIGVIWGFKVWGLGFAEAFPLFAPA